MAGRHGPALFELIRSGGNPTPPVSAPGARPAPPPPPPPAPATKPQVALPAPVEEAPPPVSPAPSRSADPAWAAWSKGGSWFDFRRSITIPMSGVLFTLAGMLVVVVVVWGAAYRLGQSKAETTARKDYGLDPGIHEPDSIPVNRDLVQGSNKAPEAKPLPPSTPLPEKKKPSRESAETNAGADPRVVGMNYDILASGLEKGAADKCVEFLNENGLPSAAAVDRKGRTSNNGTYVVFVLQGLTGSEHKAQNSPPRSDIDKLVVKLAKLAKDQKKGFPDFSQCYWQKFAG